MTDSTALYPVETLRQRIKKAQGSSRLAAKEIKLVAASKMQSVATLMEAATLGISCFGENRVQEASMKWPEVKAAFPHAHIHLIGPLQSNKVKQAVTLFDVIETLDREALADALAKEAQKQGRCPELLIQVNTGEEAQKGGVLPQALPGLLEYSRHLGLPVVGLMCIPPAHQPASPHFAFLRKLACEHGLTHLSMGMSEDFEQAIACGATEVRLGRVLFGEQG